MKRERVARCIHTRELTLVQSASSMHLPIRRAGRDGSLPERVPVCVFASSRCEIPRAHLSITGRDAVCWQGLLTF
jgi:hypothetical protein